MFSEFQLSQSSFQNTFLLFPFIFQFNPWSISLWHICLKELRLALRRWKTLSWGLWVQWLYQKCHELSFKPSSIQGSKDITSRLELFASQSLDEILCVKKLLESLWNKRPAGQTQKQKNIHKPTFLIYPMGHNYQLSLTIDKFSYWRCL